MWPVTSAILTINEITYDWAHELKGFRSADEIGYEMWAEWMKGNLIGEPIGLRLLHFRRLVKNGSVKLYEQERSKPVELDDGSCIVNFDPEVKAPSRPMSEWTDELCIEAFRELATSWSSVPDWDREGVVHETLIFVRVAYENFEEWLKHRQFKLPEFWQPASRHRHGNLVLDLPKKVGRPSCMSLIIAEHERRLRSGSEQHRVTEEARTLYTWFSTQNPSMRCPSVNTIRRAITQSRKVQNSGGN